MKHEHSMKHEHKMPTIGNFVDCRQDQQTEVIITVTIPISAKYPPTPEEQRALAYACGELASFSLHTAGAPSCTWAGPQPYM